MGHFASLFDRTVERLRTRIDERLDASDEGARAKEEPATFEQFTTRLRDQIEQNASPLIRGAQTTTIQGRGPAFLEQRLQERSTVPPITIDGRVPFSEGVFPEIQGLREREQDALGGRRR